MASMRRQYPSWETAACLLPAVPCSLSWRRTRGPRVEAALQRPRQLSRQLIAAPALHTQVIGVGCRQRQLAPCSGTAAMHAPARSSKQQHARLGCSPGTRGSPPESTPRQTAAARSRGGLGQAPQSPPAGGRERGEQAGAAGSGGRRRRRRAPGCTSPAPSRRLSRLSRPAAPGRSPCTAQPRPAARSGAESPRAGARRCGGCRPRPQRSTGPRPR